MITLESTQPLTENSIRNISWWGEGGGKGGRCLGMTALPPSCTDFPEIWYAHSPGTLTANPCLQSDCFTFTFMATYWFQLLFSVLLWTFKAKRSELLTLSLIEYITRFRGLLPFCYEKHDKVCVCNLIYFGSAHCRVMLKCLLKSHEEVV